MARTIKIDPITRIEGHLAFHVEVSANRVVEAFCFGEMFRGFEVILKDRHPMDAQQITQRICGVCPISHGIASVLAQEAAYQVVPPRNGILLRNLVQCLRGEMHPLPQGSREPRRPGAGWPGTRSRSSRP